MGTLKFKWNNELDPFYTVPEGDTEYTLHTNKKMMKDQLVAVKDDDIQSYTINYAGLTTGEQEGSYILNTAKKMMADDITGSINNKKVDNFITFSSPQSFTIGGTSRIWGFAFTEGVQYKTPSSEWTNCRPTASGNNHLWGETITAILDSNTNLYSISFRATGRDGEIVSDGSNNGLFPISRDSADQIINISGNLASLIDYQKVERNENITIATGAFQRAFYASYITSAENLVFPATTASNCYRYMFQACYFLVVPPRELPADTAEQYCYESMFRLNYKLESAPEIKATTFRSYSCQSMFNGCSKLQTPPILASNILEINTAACRHMLSECTTLTTPPILSATTIAAACYEAMFSSCTSLTAPPALPATTVSTSCYKSMFYKCSSMTALPQLAAPTLANYCYQSMFYGCSLIKLSTTKTGAYQTVYRIPVAGVSGVTATGALSNTFTSTGGTFKGTPDINTAYYTSNSIITISSS